MNPSSQIPLRSTAERTVAEEWELVLIAEGLSPAVWSGPEGFVVGVPGDQVGQAHEALSAYDRENPVEPPQEFDPARSSYPFTELAAAAVLLAFFFITGPPESGTPWFDRGSADAGRILHGELWRSVTALTLHSDVAHALANSVALALFLTVLGGSMGPGVAALVVLLSGAMGNLVNAWFYGAHHLSIGASTSVFGAVGLLGGVRAGNRPLRRRSRHRFWIPLGASLALLAMLGTSGQRTDLWGHFFGLLAGGLFGIITAPLLSHPPRPLVQWAAGFGSLVILILSWLLALR